jgi:hypothetical protein
MSTNATQQKKPIRPFRMVLGLLGIVIGFYCGPMIFIPLAGGTIACLLAMRFAPTAAKPFIPALAVIFGHMFWMLVGAILAHTIAPESWRTY